MACTEEATSCVHFVLMWEELQGHMACHSGFDKFLSVNQFIEL
jgi:hypothetical protein